MSGPDERTGMKRGDVQADKDGSRWIVTHVEHDGPRQTAARVREGSLAARVIFGRDPRRSSS